MVEKKLLVLPYVDIFETGGGMVTSIRRLLRNLSSLGWSGVILSELWDYRHAENTCYHNFNVEFITPRTNVWVPIKKPYQVVKYWMKAVNRALLLNKYLQNGGYRLLYVTGPPSFPMTGIPNIVTYWMLLKKIHDFRVVVGVRGASTTWLSNPVAGKIFHAEEYAQIKKSDRFTCVDHYILTDNFPEWLRTKGIVITNTVETERFYPMPELERNNVILYVGGLAEERGILTFLKAAENLKDTDAKFLIAGRGALEKYVRRFISEKGIDAELLGAVPYEMMAETYNRASAVVNPTPAEGIGNITLEAMACGKCVIRAKSRTRNYAINDGENGILFETGNPDDLAEKIRWVLMHTDKRKQIGVKARETILAEYTETKEAQKYDNLFSSLLE